MQTSDQVKPVSLFQIVTRIESGGCKNPLTAMRFEPVIFDNPKRPPNEWIISRIVNANDCSRKTASVIYAMSWGAPQIMGFNLYSDALKCPVSIGEYLNSETMQILMFDAFVASVGINFAPSALASTPEARRQFAKKYNGSLNYLSVLCDSLKHFGFTIKAG